MEIGTTRGGLQKHHLLLGVPGVLSEPEELREMNTEPIRENPGRLDSLRKSGENKGPNEKENQTGGL